MNSQVFLSASIPIPGRKPFDRDIEVKRIRDSVLALVEVCRDRNMSLTFGGHPAISPLVHHAADSLGVTERVTIFQSEFYRNMVPEAALKFPNLIWTPPGHDDLSSQAIMRDAMLNPRERPYDVAIFIGGMEGIFDEARRFHGAYSGKPMIPLRHTGGASRMLVQELSNEPNVDWRIPEYEQDATSMHRYRRLLNGLLATL